MILKDKVFLVTGVANEKSIAWGIVQALHRQGAKMVFTYHSEKSLRKLNNLLKKSGIHPLCVTQCDVLDNENMERAFTTISGKVDNIDGISHSIAFADVADMQKDYIDTSRDGYLLAQNSSAYSLVALARHAKPLMKNGGSIVTQTYLGSTRVVKNYNIMGIAKASLEASVKYLAEDLGKHGIRVNAVSSGPLLTSASSVIPGIKESLLIVKERAPLRRNIGQAEVGDATMFLLSGLSRGVTGEVLHVDAGYHILAL